MTSNPLQPTADLATGQEWDTPRWKPRFFIIWSGQAVSLIGSALTQFVLVWWITQTTGSASALATAGIMAMLPQALFGPLGGTLADRWSRRLVMIVADLITAGCMLILVLLFASGRIQLWHVYTLMFIRSTMQAFQSPAAAASTSMLVPPAWLNRAAGMNQTLQGLMSVAAAPLGAAALGIFPLQGALMIDVATALLGITPLVFFRIPQAPRTDMHQIGVWQDFRQGLRLLSSNRGLLWLYGLMMFMVGVLMPAFVMAPLLVRDEFGGGVDQVAMMESISGIGMLMGGVLVVLMALPVRRIVVVLATNAVSCAAIALTGLVPGDMFWLAVVWWFVSGLTYTMGSAPTMAILQTIVPNQLQGRALSLFSTLMGIAGPIGLALAAPLGELTGTRGLLIGGGVLATLVCLAGFLSPSLMRIEERHLNIEG
ncbi:MAG: MFS transporter [Anaerolineaceae bacterium]|nr:MFS transporter [Anaerolineaceae bacterium]